MNSGDVRIGDELVVCRTDFSGARNGARCIVVGGTASRWVVNWLTHTPLLRRLYNAEVLTVIAVTPCELYARDGEVVFNYDGECPWYNSEYRNDKGISGGGSSINAEVTKKPQRELRSQICQAIMANVRSLRTHHFYGTNMVTLKEVIGIIIAVDNEWRNTLDEKKAAKKEVPFNVVDKVLTGQVTAEEYPF